MLQTYKDMGIKRIVALRGDLPSGMASIGEFQYANELVSFIRAQTGEHFHIEVAAYPEFHPQAKSPRDDLLNFKRKIIAGANSAITQYFYNADGYFHFVDECRKLGVTVPIVPGIMPIVKFSQLARFSDACGAEIPRWMRKHAGKLWRRQRIGAGFRPGCGHATVRAPARGRRAGPAFLHAEPGRAFAGNLEAAGALMRIVRTLSLSGKGILPHAAHSALPACGEG